ncbi:hypothetical protein KAR10_07680, partial [bacterium]|nr:hypothetical protein [bacterium]
QFKYLSFEDFDFISEEIPVPWQVTGLGSNQKYAFLYPYAGFEEKTEKSKVDPNMGKPLMTLHAKDGTVSTVQIIDKDDWFVDWEKKTLDDKLLVSSNWSYFEGERYKRLVITHSLGDQELAVYDTAPAKLDPKVRALEFDWQYMDKLGNWAYVNNDLAIKETLDHNTQIKETSVFDRGGDRGNPKFGWAEDAEGKHLYEYYWTKEGTGRGIKHIFYPDQKYAEELYRKAGDDLFILQRTGWDAKANQMSKDTWTYTERSTQGSKVYYKVTDDLEKATGNPMIKLSDTALGLQTVEVYDSSELLNLRYRAETFGGRVVKTTAVVYLEDGRVKHHSENIDDGKTAYTIFNNAVERLSLEYSVFSPDGEPLSLTFSHRGEKGITYKDTLDYVARTIQHVMIDARGEIKDTRVKSFEGNDIAAMENAVRNGDFEEMPEEEVSWTTAYYDAQGNLILPALDYKHNQISIKTVASNGASEETVIMAFTDKELPGLKKMIQNEEVAEFQGTLLKRIQGQVDDQGRWVETIEDFVSLTKEIIIYNNPITKDFIQSENFNSVTGQRNWFKTGVDEKGDWLVNANGDYYQRTDFYQDGSRIYGNGIDTLKWLSGPVKKFEILDAQGMAVRSAEAEFQKDGTIIFPVIDTASGKMETKRFNNAVEMEFMESDLVGPNGEKLEYSLEIPGSDGSRVYYNLDLRDKILTTVLYHNTGDIDTKAIRLPEYEMDEVKAALKAGEADKLKGVEMMLAKGFFGKTGQWIEQTLNLEEHKASIKTVALDTTSENTVIRFFTDDDLPQLREMLENRMLAKYEGPLFKEIEAQVGENGQWDENAKDHHIGVKETTHFDNPFIRNRISGQSYILSGESEDRLISEVITQDDKGECLRDEQGNPIAITTFAHGGEEIDVLEWEGGSPKILQMYSPDKTLLWASKNYQQDGSYYKNMQVYHEAGLALNQTDELLWHKGPSKSNRGIEYFADGQKEYFSSFEYNDDYTQAHKTIRGQGELEREEQYKNILGVWELIEGQASDGTSLSVVFDEKAGKKLYQDMVYMKKGKLINAREEFSYEDNEIIGRVFKTSDGVKDGQIGENVYDAIEKRWELMQGWKLVEGDKYEFIRKPQPNGNVNEYVYLTGKPAVGLIDVNGLKSVSRLSSDGNLIERIDLHFRTVEDIYHLKAGNYNGSVERLKDFTIDEKTGALQVEKAPKKWLGLPVGKEIRIYNEYFEQQASWQVPKFMAFGATPFLAFLALRILDRARRKLGKMGQPVAVSPGTADVLEAVNKVLASPERVLEITDSVEQIKAQIKTIIREEKCQKQVNQSARAVIKHLQGGLKGDVATEGQHEYMAAMQTAKDLIKLADKIEKSMGWAELEQAGVRLQKELNRRREEFYSDPRKDFNDEYLAAGLAELEAKLIEIRHMLHASLIENVNEQLKEMGLAMVESQKHENGR